MFTQTTSSPNRTPLCHLVAAAALVAGVALGVAAERPAAAQDGPRFSVVDLGSLRSTVASGQSNGSRAFAINANGDITGDAQTDSGAFHAFTWKNGARTDLGTLGGRSTGFGINGSGVVAGVAQDANGRTRAFRFSNGLLQDLGTLGGSNSQGLAINSAGQIAGGANNGQDQVQAVIFQNSAITPLGSLGGATSKAFGIDNLGLAVGEAKLTNGTDVPFLFSNGAMIQMPTLGAPAGRLAAINDFAQMVGESKTAAGQLHAYGVFGGGTVDMGTLGGPASHAFAINRNSVVVGEADTASGAANAFIWSSSTGTLNLNNLISVNAGWVLQEAHGINDSGLITGFGINPGGETRGFLLVPQVLQSLTFNPNPVFGSLTATGTVTLSAPASVDLPVSISLAPGVHDGTASFPGTVVIPRGHRSATFTVNTQLVTANHPVEIHTSFSGVDVAATLTVKPQVPQSLTFNPDPVVGGANATGRVTIQGTASRDLNVALASASSSPDSTISFPPTVTIPANHNSATFTVTTQSVTTSHVLDLRASLNGVAVLAGLAVRPIGVRSISVTPSSVAGGLAVSGLVNLDFPAAPGAITVTITSTPTAVAPITGANGTGSLTVTVLQGQSTASFAIVTRPVQQSTPVIVAATANGIAKTTQLTVRPPRITRFIMEDTQTIGGQSALASVELETDAPFGGVRVVVGTDPAFAECDDFDGNPILSFVIPEGVIGERFLVRTKPVSADRTITVRAATTGDLHNTTLLIKKARVQSLVLKDTTVITGFSTELTVNLDGPAADDLAVTLSSDNTDVATLPTSVTIPAGAQSAKVTVQSKLIALTTSVRLSGRVGGDTRSTSLKVQAF